MKFSRIFILIFSLWIFVNPVVVLSEEANCYSLKMAPITVMQKTACLAECELYFKNNPDFELDPASVPVGNRGVCEILSGKLARAFSFEEGLIDTGACMSGAWQGVLTLPETAKAYLSAIEGYTESVKAKNKEYNQFLEKCQKDLSCRREIARGMGAYFAKDSSGKYIKSDKEVDQEIQGRSVIELMNIAQRNRIDFKRSCSERMSVITPNSFTEEGASDPKFLLRRYEAIGKWDPQCIAALKLERPANNSVEKKTKAPDEKNRTWIESLGIKTQCYPREKILEFACYEAAKFIVDPLNLAVGGGVLASKALKTAGLSLKSAKQARASAAAANIKSETIIPAVERRTPEALHAPKSGKDPRTFARENYIDSYLSKEITTETQNRAWMKEAERSIPDGKSVFLDVENSQMKFLNDSIKDKNLVTALTNRHKEILSKKLNSLKSEFPDLELLEYSDFKSSRFVFKGKKSPINPELQKRLNEVFQTTNTEFMEELVSKNVLRSDYFAKWTAASTLEKEQLAAEWFRAGIGETADQATLAARYSRNAAGPNQARSFSDFDFQENMKVNLKAVEMTRTEVQKELGTTGLLEVIPESGGKMLPRRDVIDIARKNKDAKSFQETIQKKYKIELTDASAQRLQDYLKMVDDFSPGIHIPKREMANLNDAVHGGLSADFSGMGSYNLYETASGLARSKDLNMALTETRQGERAVTKFFHQRMQNRQGIIRNYLEDKKQMVGLKINCSGDDCVAIVPSEMSPKNREELVQRLSRTDDPSSMRISFINSGIETSEARNALATHGEAIEKKLRAELVGKIPHQTLDKVTFAIEMNGAEVGQGQVRLITGNSRKPLTPFALKKINQSFENAVRKVNHDIIINTGKTSEYYVAPSAGK